MTSSARRGAGFALAAAALWGGTVPFAKRVLDTGVDPIEAGGLLYVGATLGLSLLLLARSAAGTSPPRLAGATRRDWRYLLFASMIGGFAAPALAMIGQSRSSGMAAALLLNLELPATAAIAVLVFHERVTARLIGGALFVLSGALLIGLRGVGNDASGVAATTTIGALAMAGSCVCWGIDNNATTRVAHLDALRIARVKGLVAAPFSLLLAYALRGRPVWDGAWTAASTAEILIIGFVGYGVGLACIVAAFRHLGAARTGALFATAPFIGAVMTVPILGEAPTATIAIAGALMAGGVLLLARDRA